jgi:diguanylate cyclase (GGDEF)-like protein
VSLSFSQLWKVISIASAVCALFAPLTVSAETVSLQLKWSHQFQFAGYYAAVEKGFYREEGLDVVLREGLPLTKLVDEVTGGNADFGVDNTSLLVERDHGKGVVVLAAIFQHSPQVLIARKDSDILSPHDLKSKKVMMVKEQSTDIMAMLSNEGVAVDQVNFVPHTWNVNDLIEGKVDAMTVYTTAEPFVLQEKNIPINIIHPINYGIDYYGDCLFTSEKQIAANPELVKRFVRASLKGWEYAMSHQDELIDLIIAKYNPKLSRNKLHFEAVELQKVILPEYVDLGHMNPGRWAKIAEIHQKYGLLSQTFSLDKFIYKPGNYSSTIYQKLLAPLFAIIGLLLLGLIAFVTFNFRLKQIVQERTVTLEEKISQLKEKEETIRLIAYHDVLTDLPNRLMFIEQLGRNTTSAHDRNNHFAVVFLDLDDFKRINDAMGHAAGDEFLRIVARRLQHCLQNRGTVYRLGGDEFILLFADTSNYAYTIEIVERVIAAVRMPWNFRGNDFYLSASIGIAMYPKDGQDPDFLIKAADMAMYEAKRQGKNRYQFFSEAMHSKSIEKLTMEYELHQAIANSEFVLHYQPQMDCGTSIIGVEALIRWNHPTKGLLPPGVFIPLAEETGLIVPIGDWAIRCACQQCMEWQSAELTPIRVSVNLSVRQLQHANLLEKIRTVLDETGLPPNLLELEITETVAVTHADLVVPLMDSLRALGVRLALDDFGTGYSSLMYLKKFPIDILKIDKSFIQDITVSQDNEAIIQTILSLAKILQIGTVAEGVETMEQYNCLKSLSCPIMQGYLFSRPIPAQELQTFLRNYQS